MEEHGHRSGGRCTCHHGHQDSPPLLFLPVPTHSLSEEPQNAQIAHRELRMAQEWAGTGGLLGEVKGFARRGSGRQGEG